MDRFEALRNYRLRERIEEHFGMDKRYFDGRRTSLWKADALRGRSTVDIFDWFDCIETTEVRTEAGKFRWSTESIRRDQLFLERLGVVKSALQAAAASPAAGPEQ